MDAEKEARLRKIYDMLVRPGHTKQEIMSEAQRWEQGGKKLTTYSERTFRYDINIIQKVWGKEVLCERGEDGQYRYRFKDPKVEALNDFDLTPKHFRALRLAQEALKQTLAIPESDVLGEVIESLELQAKSQGVAEKTKRKRNVIRYGPCPIHPIDSKIWNPVLEATENLQELKFKYKPAWGKDKPPEMQTVYPLKIVNLKGVWYVLALEDLHTEKWKQYNFSRIESPRVMKKKFPYPYTLDLDIMIDNTFGRMISPAKHWEEVTLHFSKTIASLITGYRFHEKQKITHLGNGGIELKFPVTDYGVNDGWRYYHVRSWILSFGRYCKVVGPEELKQKVKADRKNACKRFSYTAEME